MGAYVGCSEGRLAVIPTLILFGLVFGRWWRSALVAATLGWAVVLVVGDVTGVEPELLGASGLAMANTGVGVLIHQGVLRMIRLRRTAPD
jgi:hypothetical protein